MSQTQTPTIIVNSGDSAPYTSGSQVFAGDVDLIGLNPAVAPMDIGVGFVGTLTVTARVRAPKDNSVFNQGDPVYWNPTGNPTGGTAGTGCATSQSSGNYPWGTAALAQLTGDATVDILQALKPPALTQLSAGAAANDVITNTASETAFLTVATVPAGTLKTGDTIHVRAAVEVTAQNSTNTNDVKLKITTAANTFTVVVDTGAVNAAANAIALIDVDLVFTAVGNAGSFYAVGQKAFGAQGTANMSPVALAATSINTSLPLTIELTDTQSAASTGNVAQLLELQAEIKRR